MSNMKVGFCGLGKLGLPVAVTMAWKGFDVMGFDIDDLRMSKKPQPFIELGPDRKSDFNDWLDASSIKFGSLAEVVKHATGGIIFVAVQTPHDAPLGGASPLTSYRSDFNYDYLREVIKSLSEHIKKKTVIAIISTVLPGAIRSKILPLVNPDMAIVYNPLFIAMGTTMADFLSPEFVLIGSNDEWGSNVLAEFYRQFFLGYTPSMAIRKMSIESAELTKVSYNTYITSKIVFANTLLEICHKTGADVDDVTGTLKLARQRLISPRYMDAGMGDGGACHPRDNIAMSWLAIELKLSHNIFDDLMMAREHQADWLAGIVYRYAGVSSPRRRTVLVGYAFKAESTICDGSPALLVGNILKSRYKINLFEFDHKVGIIDPRGYDDGGEFMTTDIEALNYELQKFKGAVFLIGCSHKEHTELKFPVGSIVIDPFRYILDQKGVNVVRLGENKGNTPPNGST